MVVSWELEAKILPSGENAIEVISPE